METEFSVLKYATSFLSDPNNIAMNLDFEILPSHAIPMNLVLIFEMKNGKELKGKKGKKE